MSVLKQNFVFWRRHDFGHACFIYAVLHKRDERLICHADVRSPKVGAKRDCDAIPPLAPCHRAGRFSPGNALFHTGAPRKTRIAVRDK